MKHTIIFSAFLVSSCAVTNPSYNQSGLAPEELARVKTYVVPWLKNGHSASINRVYSESGNLLLGSNSLFSNEGAFLGGTLEPGKYHFDTRCDDGFTYSFPKVTAEVKGGVSYILFCERIIEEKAFLGLNQIRANRVKIIEEKDFSPDIISDTRYEKE